MNYWWLILLWSENVRIQEKLQTFCNFLGSSDFLNFNLFGNYQDNLVYNIFFYIFFYRGRNSVRSSDMTEHICHLIGHKFSQFQALSGHFLKKNWIYGHGYRCRFLTFFSYHLFRYHTWITLFIKTKRLCQVLSTYLVIFWFTSCI